MLTIRVFVFSLLAAAFAMAQATSNVPQGREVIAFLNQTITWHRHLSSEQQLATEPNDLLFLNDDREVADQVVRLSFDFAKANAQLLAGQKATAAVQGQDGGGSSAVTRYTALVTKYEEQMKKSQQEHESLKQKLSMSTGRKRQAVESAIAETKSEIELAQARRDSMRSLLDFMSGTNGATDLRSQIEELERTIPAVIATDKKAGRGQAPAVAPTLVAKPQPSGILGLTSDLLSLRRKMGALDESVRLTDSLAQTSKGFRAPLIARLKELARQGDEVANQPVSDDPAMLAKQKAQLDALTAQFKQLSAAVLPLGKQNILMDVYKRNLANWRASVEAQYSTELRSLVLRLAALAIVLAVVVAMSKLWSRAIYRYVRDARRQHQLLLVRRIATWFVVAMIIAFSFATELGSLATFAGLLTAGVALALQNVILSVVAYFFLIGKYGIRVGDRVQICGVTGEVLDIGLVRLHLMEVGEQGVGGRPTGRVVVFSNAVVFQANAGFFKQIPGTNFVWHEITLTLASDSDYRLVEERLVGAVQSVFGKYSETMDHQHRQMERALSPLAVHSLRPQSRLRLTQAGLEVVIRYPLELEKAAEIDDRITRELLDAIEREPKLKVVGSGTPNIQPVAQSQAAMAGSSSPA
jgi:small-conductance mechanosensitive channel